MTSRAKELLISLGEESTDSTESTIKTLTSLGSVSSNDEQGKMVQLLKGLAFSDDAGANKFMADLAAAMSKMDPSSYS